MRDAGHRRTRRRVRLSQCVEAAQDPVGRLQRIDAALGFRRMAGSADDFHLEMQAAVVRRGDRIGKAGADRVIGLRQCALEQPRRSERTTRLFVVSEMQFDRAVERSTCGGRRKQRPQCERICREVRLRNGDSASVHDAVAHLRPVRVGRPMLARRHDVTVCVQSDRRAAARAEMRAHDEIGAGNHAMRGHFFREEPDGAPRGAPSPRATRPPAPHAAHSRRADCPTAAARARRGTPPSPRGGTRASRESTACPCSLGAAHALGNHGACAIVSRRYRWRNCGLRFSTNARMPSF